MIRPLLIGSVFYLLSIGACRQQILVEEKIEFPDAEWTSGSTTSLTIEAPDTTVAYDMVIEVRHDEDYSFQNLYIRTHVTFPSGKNVSSTTSLELANQDGTWAGNCSGDKCLVSLPLQTGFTFPEIGKYQWEIEPYMRQDTIRGIRSLEVICKKSKE